MKLIARILIVLLAFGVVAGLLMVFDSMAVTLAVSAGLIDEPRAEHRGPRQTDNPQRDSDGANQNQARPKPSITYMIKRWVLGMGKNVAVMAVLVAVIVFPKSLAKKNRKMAYTTNKNLGE
ncbi:MAG: hypothetical protein RIR73_2324 [Chloroflexota bacterium]|jgi:hypothetical protein